MTHPNSFDSAATLTVGSQTYTYFDITKVGGSGHLPFTHKVLLENLLRCEDGANVTADQIRAIG